MLNNYVCRAFKKAPPSNRHSTRVPLPGSDDEEVEVDWARYGQGKVHGVMIGKPRNKGKGKERESMYVSLVEGVSPI